MLRFHAHGRGDDWCHACGTRNTAPKVDVWLPDNAEHYETGTRYLRFCVHCIRAMERAALGEHFEGRDEVRALAPTETPQTQEQN
ncbi:MAG: hypothetical protein V3W06_09115 [Acidimicrobiia bacterium]